MSLISSLVKIWGDSTQPFLFMNGEGVTFSNVIKHESKRLSKIKRGDVVAVIGDFEATSIFYLLKLIEIGVIIVPLSKLTSNDHEYFFESAQVDYVLCGEELQKLRTAEAEKGPLIKELIQRNSAGLVLFSTGTTGRPKAILHDLGLFLKRFETPRPALRTLSFLLFDHIGGINTLLHTLYNKGVIVSPKDRSVHGVLETCQDYEIEVLPTTPTFLRMMLFAEGAVDNFPASLKVVTYGTERMDQPTLSELCRLLPQVDFRQTYGMSEIGILRVKSEARDSLFMKIGGEGVETRVEQGVLFIRSGTRMMGYLNAESPFDENGWYNTKDVVEVKGEYLKVVGRTTEVINVGGLKFMASEVERVALESPFVSQAKVVGRSNPITGQHVEIIVEPKNVANFSEQDFAAFLKGKLQSHMVPRRISINHVAVGHRFKKL